MLWWPVKSVQMRSNSFHLPLLYRASIKTHLFCQPDFHVLADSGCKCSFSNWDSSGVSGTSSPCHHLKPGGGYCVTGSANKPSELEAGASPSLESSTIVSLQSVAHSCRDLHENNNNNNNNNSNSHSHSHNHNHNHNHNLTFKERYVFLSHYILCGWVAGGITSGLGVILVRMGTMLRNLTLLSCVKRNVIELFDFHLVIFLHHEVSRAEKAVHGMHNVTAFPNTLHFRNKSISLSPGMQKLPAHKANSPKC